MTDSENELPDPSTYLHDHYGLTFHEPAQVLIAMTHRSYAHEHNAPDESHNERLEFLGDAVLDFLVANWLYKQLPNTQEGKLTRLRSALVRTESLAVLATQLGIGGLLRLGVGEEASGGRTRARTLCGAFEALCGVLYLDQGVEAVRAFVLPQLQPALAQIISEESDKDAKSRLQEWTYATLNQPPVYTVQSADGPEHQRLYTIEVRLMDGQLLGSGQGTNKRRAEQAAARQALRTLDSMPVAEAESVIKSAGTAKPKADSHGSP
jgi:ribonuclease III